MEHILNKIKEYNKIIIHGHIRPDGDSIGSQYGLMYLIKNTFPNKEVYVTGESSEYVSFIGTPNLIDETIFNNALSICVDCATSKRLSDTRINLSDYVIKIDHHLKDEEYADYEYIDDNASSVTEIITEFYIQFKNELIMTKECAEALYTGLLTDTGNFRNANVSEKTFLVAAELIRNGVDINYINKSLSNDSIELLRLKGYVINNFKITDNGFAYIVLDKKTINEYNVSEEDAATLVTVISNLKDIPVWAMILETDSEIRIRLRSNGPNINELATLYNGGGHKLASGAKLLSWNELDKFVNEADELVKKYKVTLQ